jgi:hypothetical protein
MTSSPVSVRQPLLKNDPLGFAHEPAPFAVLVKERGLLNLFWLEKPNAVGSSAELIRMQQHALDALGDRLDFDHFDRPGATAQAPGALVVGGGVDVGQVGALAEEGRAEPKIGDDGAQLVPS